MKLGDQVVTKTWIYLHHMGSWDSLFWLVFVPSNSQFFNETFCQGRPKPKQKPRCVILGGRAGGRSEPRLRPGGCTFEIYYLWIIWHIFSLIQFWIATFIYQYWNAKEWKYHTHISMVAVLSKYIETEPPKLIFGYLWYLAILQTWPIWEVSLSKPPKIGDQAGSLWITCRSTHGHTQDMQRKCVSALRQKGQVGLSRS